MSSTKMTHFFAGKLADAVCAIFHAGCANFLPVHARTLFFAYLSFSGGPTRLLSVFHFILGQIRILLYHYFLRVLSICAIFYAFSNYAAHTTKHPKNVVMVESYGARQLLL